MTQVLEPFSAEESIYTATPEFECGYFDVLHDDPVDGLVLVIHGQRPKHAKRQEFLQRLHDELKYQGVCKATLFSRTPLFVEFEQRVHFQYIGVFEEHDKISSTFGPFHQYEIKIKEVRCATHQ